MLNQNVNTNVFFSGGAGIFIEYYDIVRPVYLYAALKMLYTNTTYGLPLEMIKHLSSSSLVEWYCNRRYQNPLYSLDPLHKATHSQLDSLLSSVLQRDSSIYKLAPPLNIYLMMQACVSHKISFPVYVYTSNYDEHAHADSKSIFPGMPTHYLHGPLDKTLSQCDQNFTYIFSNIHTLVQAAYLLKGTCSHVLLAREYRYNYKDFFKTYHYDLFDIQSTHQFLRIGTTFALDRKRLANAINITLQGGG